MDNRTFVPDYRDYRKWRLKSLLRKLIPKWLRKKPHPPIFR